MCPVGFGGVIDQWISIIDTYDDQLGDHEERVGYTVEVNTRSDYNLQTKGHFEDTSHL